MFTRGRGNRYVEQNIGNNNNNNSMVSDRNGQRHEETDAVMFISDHINTNVFMLNRALLSVGHAWKGWQICGKGRGGGQIWETNYKQHNEFRNVMQL